MTARPTPVKVLEPGDTLQSACVFCGGDGTVVLSDRGSFAKCNVCNGEWDLETGTTPPGFYDELEKNMQVAPKAKQPLKRAAAKKAKKKMGEKAEAKLDEFTHKADDQKKRRVKKRANPRI